MRLWKNWNALIFVILLIILFLPLSGAAAQDENGAQVGVFEDYELQPGSRVEVPIEIKDVEELYAIDIEIKFDPAVLSIEDADSKTDGVQPALGIFLDAGLTLYNTVDNEAGVIRFVMSQVNPSEPKSGDGIILVLYVQGLAEGESDLEVTTLELSNRSGEAISAEPVDAQVNVSDVALAKESTSIPVQDPTSMVLISTSEATDVSVNLVVTLTPTPANGDGTEALVESTILDDTNETAEEAGLSETTTPTALQEDVSEDEVQSAVEVEEDAVEQSGFSLLENWWIVVLVVVLAVGLGLYLCLTRK